MNGLSRLYKTHKWKQSKGPTKSRIVDYPMIIFLIASRLIKISSSIIKKQVNQKCLRVVLTNLNLKVSNKFVIKQNLAMMFKLASWATTYNNKV